MLALSKPAERQAPDFLVRATRKRDGMWKLLSLRRQGDVLLCVVRWTHRDIAAKPFSLGEVLLTEVAVHWWYFASPDVARAETERRCAMSMTSQGATETTSSCYKFWRAA